jgi:hypothetical protein
MKKMLFTLMAMVTMTISAQAMTINEARREAFFLTDKMAYELNLSYSQYEAVYEINLDYLTSLAVSDDIFGFYWERRNEDLSFVLSTYQYRTYMAREYFYRPVYWQSGFTFRIYTHYTDRRLFYFARPSHYATYNGGHSWRNNGNRSYYKGLTFERSKAIPNYVPRQRSDRSWNSMNRPMNMNQNININRNTNVNVNRNSNINNNRNSNINNNRNSNVNRNTNENRNRQTNVQRNTNTNRSNSGGSWRNGGRR